MHSWDLATGVDGPGTRFTLFTSGCPLRCRYCHNPDTWHLRDGHRATADEVMAEITKCRAFLIASGGGVTVSGGRAPVPAGLHRRDSAPVQGTGSPYRPRHLRLPRGPGR
ncbi:hypothetical protein GCM10020000_04690 [Streptomyces olivoverticillatus]